MSFTYRRDILDSGIRVVTETTREVRSLALGFWVGVGSSFEPAGLSGVSHFIEHILFKGTRRRSAFQIANDLESVGGMIDAFAGRENTAFVCRCLPEQLRRSVDVVSDMLCDPAMRRDAIELEKQVIFEEIRNYEDSPEDVIHELIAKSVWGRNPLAKPVLGTMDSVAGLRRETILRYFRDHYVSGNLVVAASGRVDHRRLVGLVERMLKVPRKPAVPEPEPYHDSLPRIHNVKRKVGQCYICMGVEGPAYVENRRYVTLLLSMVLGGGMTSRLFQQVREKRGLAYSVYSSADFYRRGGIFVVFLAVDPKKARDSVAHVSRELRRIKRSGVKRDELKSAKQQLKASLLLGLESMTSRMNRLARQELYLSEYIPVESTLRKAMNVSRDALAREARRILDASRFSMITIGPASTEFPKVSDLDF
jgi:predicted Zn-dependent peptidase